VKSEENSLILYSLILYSLILYSLILYSLILYSLILYSLILHSLILYSGGAMSRLTNWFIKFTGIKGRQQARYRAYQSEALSAKMRVVKRAQGKQKGGR